MTDKISDPRDEFEKIFPIPSATIRCGTGYAVTSYSAWEGQAYENKWEGWQAARRAAEVRPICVRQAIKNMEHHEYCDSINVAYKHGWNDAIKAAGGTVEG